MSIKKFTVGTTALGGALVAVAALTVSPASAATGYARCPADRLCVFTEPAGRGAIGIFRVGDYDLGAAPGPSGLDNDIESLWNRSGDIWYFYPDRGYRGDDGTTGIIPRKAKATLSKVHQNDTSSLRIIG